MGGVERITECHGPCIREVGRAYDIRTTGFVGKGPRQFEFAQLPQLVQEFIVLRNNRLLKLRSSKRGYEIFVHSKDGSKDLTPELRGPAAGCSVENSKQTGSP
jgi:hypothetical protein